MSRDFILIFSGGMVSLITTLVVLFVADYIYRREQIKQTKPDATPQSELPKLESTPRSEPLKSEPARSIESKSEPPHPPESKLIQAQEDKPA